jgi:uncharacterized membrane protein
MTRFALDPIYGSTWLALLIAVATVALIAGVTPPSENRAHRRLLILLRSIAALAMLSTVFRPALVRTDNRPADATLVVAADTSRSMTLPDGDGNDRWSTQRESWQQLATGLAGLDQSLSIRLIAYDKTARLIAESDASALDSQAPEGELTDLAAAALAAIQSAEGSPIAGVVLMGDGTQTAPIQGTGAQRVVETLNSIGVPLWCVPIGPAGGATASRDAAIDALAESYQLFSGNEVAVDFQVHSRGLAGVEIPVRVSWIDATGQTEEVASRRVVPALSGDVQALSIPLTAPPPGTYRLQVEADVQEGELVTVNNRQIAFVEVRDGGGRILYLEGALRSEQLRIRKSLGRFLDLDVTYRWIPPDTASRWPVDLDNWFRPGRFDVYIVGDLDSAALGDRQLQQLADAVAAGAGLVTLGGRQSYGPGGYAESPLADVIPIRMDPSLRRAVDAISSVDAISGDEAGQLPPPVTIQLARLHPITQLRDDDPGAIWQNLPPQLGANRFLGPKVAPGVQVLLESPDEDPLLIVGEYGSGRTAALAFDSTYRWWRSGNKDVHRTFWRQLILWLLDREDTSDEKIQIDLDARRFDFADPPKFRASVQSDAPVSLVAEVIDESAAVNEVPVSSDSAVAGMAAVSGQLLKLEAGFYRLRVRPENASSPIAAEEIAFQVIDQSRELARPMADPVYLRQLAQLTAEQGGAAFAPDEIDQLIDTIALRRRQAETPIVEKYRLGDGPLSGWIVFVIFAAALAAEWFLRRRWGIA